MTPTINQVLDGMGISNQRLGMLLRELEQVQRPRFARLWTYYTNPSRPVRELTDDSERPYRQAQEWGLPARITGYRPGVDPTSDGTVTGKERKEVVIENDIAWRVDTMVDYLFGRMPVIRRGARRSSGSWARSSRTTAASASCSSLGCWARCTASWIAR